MSSYRVNVGKDIQCKLDSMDDIQAAEFLLDLMPRLKEITTPELGWESKKDADNWYKNKYSDFPDTGRKVGTFESETGGKCSVCRSTQMLENESTQTCLDCGHCTKILQISEVPTYKELQNYNRKPGNAKYTYERKDYFDQRLKNFQGIETLTVPDDVIVKIKKQFAKLRITDYSNLSHIQIRKCLQHIKQSKYYHHTELIRGILNRENTNDQGLLDHHLVPRQFDAHVVVALKRMQEVTKDVFDMYKPDKRKSAPNYSYQIRQFLTILGLGEYAKQFPLLKNPEILRFHDKWFFSVCKHLKQNGIPVVDSAISEFFAPGIDWNFTPCI